MNVKHWHVASGIAGYGPDGSDGFHSAETPEALADLVRYELATWAEYEFETAGSYAEAGDYESAWKMRAHSDKIETLRANLDNDRANAPLYAGNPTAWHDTLLRLVTEEFPFPVDKGRSNVYTWECRDMECEHFSTDD